MATTMTLVASFTLFFGILTLFSAMNESFLRIAKAEPEVLRFSEFTILIVSEAAVSDSDHVYDYRTDYLKELLNFIKNFEYTVDIPGKQIFPNDKIKQSIVSDYKSAEYNVANLSYVLLGFKITASDIKIHVDPKRIDSTKTRVNISLMHAKNVKLSNGHISLSYNQIDLNSAYGIYDKITDKMTVHIPFGVTANNIINTKGNDYLKLLQLFD
jgi:hypothetical protein